MSPRHIRQQHQQKYRVNQPDPISSFILIYEPESALNVSRL